MEITATAKYIRVSPRKVRLVLDQLREISPVHALEILPSLIKRAGEPVREVIASAISNARQKDIKPETLSFKRLEVCPGPVMKRWRAVSCGRAHGYKKRMSHIRVVLTDDLENNISVKDKGV